MNTIHWITLVSTSLIGGAAYSLRLKPNYPIGMNPKLVAYMFAGRAFLTATALTIGCTGFIASSCLWSVGAKNMNEFSSKAQQKVEEWFPQLKRSTFESEMDQETLDFIENWNKESQQVDNVMESEGHQYIKQQVLKGLGPLAP